ncbi:hypothetical protein HK414_25790 [Ramlibacter terrae]|uniref:Uncharacterized protein n=1 Tax=Ramlibacter terrae TaxID=2732511 RepID=A0ABX6P5W8_9BURK|nr:hypothetical protein HK414_25790 [Ramlibacter terrae]
MRALLLVALLRARGRVVGGPVGAAKAGARIAADRLKRFMWNSPVVAMEVEPIEVARL